MERKAQLPWGLQIFVYLFLIQKDPLEPNSGEYKGNFVAGFFCFFFPPLWLQVQVSCLCSISLTKHNYIPEEKLQKYQIHSFMLEAF